VHRDDIVISHTRDAWEIKTKTSRLVELQLQLHASIYENAVLIELVELELMEPTASCMLWEASVAAAAAGGRRNSCIIQSVLVPLPALPR
jgi:hypothetical protein